jgi:hypothetical protein
MDYNEIVRRMRAGESSDDIAKDLAAMLNKAETTLAEEKTKSNRESEFSKACATAAEAMNAALAAYGRLMNKNYGALHWDGEMCKSIIKTAVGFNDILGVMSVGSNKPIPDSNDDSFDRAVEKFFKEFNIT